MTKTYYGDRYDLYTLDGCPTFTRATDPATQEDVFTVSHLPQRVAIARELISPQPDHVITRNGRTVTIACANMRATYRIKERVGHNTYGMERVYLSTIVPAAEVDVDPNFTTFPLDFRS